MVRIRIQSSSRTQWYRHYMGKIFDVAPKNKISGLYILMNTKHNQDMLSKHLYYRLANTTIRLGVSADNAVEVLPGSNRQATGLLSEEC